MYRVAENKLEPDKSYWHLSEQVQPFSTLNNRQYGGCEIRFAIGSSIANRSIRLTNALTRLMSPWLSEMRRRDNGQGAKETTDNEDRGPHTSRSVLPTLTSTTVGIEVNY